MTSINFYNQQPTFVPDTNKKYQEPSATRKIAGGIVAAITIPKASGLMYKYLNKFVAKKFLNLAHKDGMNEAYDKILDEMVIKMGLDKKGVEIINVNKNTIKQATEKLSKLFPSPVDAPIIKKILKRCAKGDNACYFREENLIFLNRQKMAVSAIHELGHAYNKNCSKLGKFLSTLKKYKTIPKGLAFVAAMPIIFGTKKAEGEKPEGFMAKTSNFIRNNAGKIAAAGFLPEIIEEGLASYNGAKFSKGLLSKKHYMHMNKTDLLALATYLATMVGVGVAMNVGRYLKDTIAKPKEITV